MSNLGLEGLAVVGVDDDGEGGPVVYLVTAVEHSEVVVGAIFLSSLHLQRVVGLSAVQTGLAFLPPAAVITGTAAIASKLLGRVSPCTMTAFGLVVIGAALLLASSGGGQSHLADVLPGFDRHLYATANQLHR